ncbi:DNA-processing protein DprA [Micropruina sp.]|uniref:DNA-processing protein DprA n=1 Tax=Micropruina sp. TaxID=2737536 RepID=UPI0039E3271D
MLEREARMALCCAVEPGSREVTRQVERDGAEATWRTLLEPGSRSRWARRAQALDLAAVQAATSRLRLRFIVPGDDDWPAALGDLSGCEPVQDLAGAPHGLWVKGSVELAAAVDRSVAVVGARACTAYGETVATDLAAGLGAHGVTVVSGGAYGIDAAAHAGALAADAVTVAVMAGGLDQLYPAGNSGLLQRVATHGVLASELPPFERPTRVRFLGRNRLIAALAPATVLVEAALRSGARNTVSWATACNRVVLAVPGPVHSATSATPHRLIRDAEAVLCSGVEDVLELVQPLGRPAVERPSQRRPLDDLDCDELAVFEALPARGAMPTGEVSLRAGVPLGTCLGVLDRLSHRGLVAQRVDGWQMARPPSHSRG